MQTHQIWAPGDYRSSVRNDAETAMIQRQLTHALPRIYEVKNIPLVARTLFPAQGTVPKGAKTFSRKALEMVGTAKFLGPELTDVPLASARVTETLFGVHIFGAAWRWTLEDMWAAQYAGVPLPTYEGQAARKACETKLDDIAFNGDSTKNIPGLLSNTAIPNAAAGNGTWSGATAEEILQDAAQVINDVASQSYGAHRANTLLVPLDEELRMQATLVPNTTQTMLSWLKSSLGVRIVGVPSVLDTSGTGSTSQMIAYEANDINAELHVPVDFEVLPPKDDVVSLTMTAVMATGGLTVHYPKAFAKRYGI